MNYYSKYYSNIDELFSSIEHDEHFMFELCLAMLKVYRDDIVFDEFISKQRKINTLNCFIKYYESIEEYEKCKFILDLIKDIEE